MKYSKLKFVRHASFLSLSLVVCLSGTAVFAANKFEQFNSAAEEAYKNKNYPEAQANFEAAVKESEKMDKSDKRIATTIYNLALVFQAEGNYVEAEKNLLKAIEWMNFCYGTEHQRVGQVYLDLADLYVEQAGQEEKPELKKKAAENYKKGIDIFEKIYAQATGQAGEAEKPPEKSKDTDAKKKAAEDGKNAAQVAALSLSNGLRLMADFYTEDELYPKSEPLYVRSLELEEYASGPDDSDVASHKAKLAEFYCVQSKFVKAEPLFKEAIASSEKANGADSNATANILYNFGGLYYDQGSFGEAEIYFKRALAIWDKKGDLPAGDIAQKNLALADVLDMQGKHEESHLLFKKSLATFEKGPDKSVLIRGLKAYQKHLLMQNSKDEAGKIANRIKDLKAEGASKPQ